jgi:hypothetical protein
MEIAKEEALGSGLLIRIMRMESQSQATCGRGARSAALDRCGAEDAEGQMTRGERQGGGRDWTRVV